MARLSQRQYSDLLAFRAALREFEKWSQDQAKAVGLSPAQHQLLLAVKGHADRRGPTISDVAGYLCVRHHSAVGLVDRTEASGYLTRIRDTVDARVVRLQLTDLGLRRLSALTPLHVQELRRLAPLLEHLTGET